MNATQFLLNADPVLARVIATTTAPQIRNIGEDRDGVGMPRAAGLDHRVGQAP